MKKLVNTSLLILAFHSLFAGDPKTEKLKQLIKPGNKIFITATNEKAKKHAKKLLRHKCWTIVDKADSADFVLKVYEKLAFLDYFAFAAIIDPKTKEQLYKTGSTNTLMRVTFRAKKAAINKLIAKKIAPMCEPLFLESLEYEGDTF
jgi:hypothetical protein